MKLAVAVAALFVLAAAAPARLDPTVAAWVFPGGQRPPPPGGWDTGAAVALAGSAARYSEAQLHDLQHAVDWFPATHPRMPGVVASGRPPAVKACAFCHQPGGQGRPENASLAGLDAAYIEQQVAAFANGSRGAAVDGWRPHATMAETAAAATPSDIHAAAVYFHGLRYRSHVRVVEIATVPALHAEAFVLATGPGPRKPIGQRIVETPVDFASFERRDPRTAYIAFVPPGSIARGRAVAARVGCAACHGAGMKLWGAGRSPSYIVRQLLAFRSGARHDPESGPMRTAAAGLTTRDMIAVAAYWATLTP